MQLSTHFTLEEFTISQTAIRKGIDNNPSQVTIESLKELCSNILEPLRERLNQPIRITSGYRCPELNKAIGGTKHSQHIYGEAADIRVDGMSVEDLYQFIKNSGLPYRQNINEFESWIHVSISNGDVVMRENLRATKDGSKTVYSSDENNG